MKRILKYTYAAAVGLMALVASSCTKDRITPGTTPEGGALLNLAVSFDGFGTKLAELPTTDSINDDLGLGLSHIGLYMYYSSDYNADNLTRPYVKNLKCEVVNGKLIPLDGEPDIYIYDEMTVVAFYPYNEAMSAVDFNTRDDLELYPITRQDYREQYYIPYRAVTQTNPTIAYLTRLVLVPKHTFKVQVVLVGEQASDFPDDGDVQILPAVDPVGNADYPADGRRDIWVDKITDMPNGGGGSHLRLYTAYMWKNDGDNNELNRGDIVLSSPVVTLIASEDVPLQEDYVYRYGYNLNTGEIFIPTSDNFVHDIPTLQALDGSYSVAYQACDIDLSEGGDWTPIDMWRGRFDGGGHKILNMNVVADVNGRAGLFNQIQGNTVICNVNLIDPVINVTSTADTVYAGAIAGRVNSIMSEADKARYLGNLPDDLSPVVREALIAEMLAELTNTESKIAACRVENLTLTVNGTHPRVGGLVGAIGDKDTDNNENYLGSVWDSYVLGGSITVNSGNPAANADAFAGGFCGLNNGIITRSYTTVDPVEAMGEQTVTNPDGTITTTPVDHAQGFAWMGTLFTDTNLANLTGSYAVLPDVNTGVGQMPGDWPPGSWVSYTGKWPILTTGWLGSTDNSFWYRTGTPGTTDYPILQWERR